MQVSSSSGGGKLPAVVKPVSMSCTALATNDMDKKHERTGLLRLGAFAEHTFVSSLCVRGCEDG